MSTLRLRLPATSANLGPGFDAVGLALALYLTIEAEENQGRGGCKLRASGRNAAEVASTKNNLIVETYRSLAPDAPPLDLTICNEVPLGMGCGSSAAALLAGVLLANHFGQLGLGCEQVLEEACRREGHPDNVAACLLGGFTVSAMDQGRVSAATLTTTALPWKAFLALPAASLATAEARSLLPSSYSRADAVANVQATALLVSAFALGRENLLTVAMRDRLHQPYRRRTCPLLSQLEFLAGRNGVHGVALSGAGPSVLLLAADNVEQEWLSEVIEDAVGDKVEVLSVALCGGAESEYEGSIVEFSR